MKVSPTSLCVLVSSFQFFCSRSCSTDRAPIFTGIPISTPSRPSGPPNFGGRGAADHVGVAELEGAHLNATGDFGSPGAPDPCAWTQVLLLKGTSSAKFHRFIWKALGPTAYPLFSLMFGWCPYRMRPKPIRQALGEGALGSNGC